jgi:beta-galactosidase
VRAGSVGSEVVPGLAFGGDYNPEQWPDAVIDEDLALMQDAGVNLVTLGVFSWAIYEPRPGRYEFDRLMDIMDRLHAIGVAVDLATPTASPPPWLHAAHPEILHVTRTGQRYAPGGRLGWCASSPIWRQHALRIVEVLASTVGDHPALRMWHVGNEFGGGNRHCYCDVSAEHFRRWLIDRYGDVETVNRRWGTAFWGHRYGRFEEISPPRDSETIGRGNPGLVLDYDRFSSDALLSHFEAEAEVLRRLTPDIPVTTNFMVGTGPHVVDYARWEPEVDVVATDHYLDGADPHRAHDVAWAADRTRGLRPDQPWLLMETAAGATSWQARNRPLRAGELRRTAMTHIGRGADGVLFFQWRASVAGAEQFHSGMVPHAGPRSRTWRDVRQLGTELARLAPLAGSVVEPASVAVVVDDEAAWAWAAGPKPHNGYDIADVPRRWHRALWQRGIRCDVVPAARAERGALTDYQLVLVPALFALRSETARALQDVATGGARLVVGHLTGVVDGDNRVGTGGHPAALRDVLGMRVEEHVPLWEDEVVTLDNGWRGIEWAEVVDASNAVVVARHVDGPVDGGPAVTRSDHGPGQAWYVSVDLDGPSLDAALVSIADDLGLIARTSSPGLDIVQRRSSQGTFVVAVNHTYAERQLAVPGRDLLNDRVETSHVVPPGGIAVIHRETRL